MLKDRTAMNIEELKVELDLKDKDISKMFGYKNPMSYANAKRGKTKIEEGLVSFYQLIKHGTEDGMMTSINMARTISKSECL